MQYIVKLATECHQYENIRGIFRTGDLQQCIDTSVLRVSYPLVILTLPLLYTSLLRTWIFVCPKTLSIHPRLSLAHCVRVAGTLTDNRYLCLSILVPLFTLISYTTACVHASLFYGMPYIASLLSLTSFILFFLLISTHSHLL